MSICNLTIERNLLMNSLINVPACQRRDGDTDWFPAVDVSKTGQEYVCEVDLPGLKPEDVQVRVESDKLSICGRRVGRSQGGDRVRVERPSGAFVRQLPLPPDIHGEILATFCNGVLELRIARTRADRAPEPTPAVAQKPEKNAL